MKQDNCFVLMPFNSKLTSYYKRIIAPAVRKCNLQPIRADEVYGTKAIVADIFAQIISAKILIADLTGRNPNVAYELGVAHALRKPVVIITQDVGDVPFDLRHLRIIEYHTDMVGWESTLSRNIVKTIDAVFQDLEGSLAWQGAHYESLMPSKAVKELLNRTYQHIAGVYSAENEYVFDEDANVRFKHTRKQMAFTSTTHLKLEFFISCKGEIRVVEIFDLDNKVHLDYVIYEQTQDSLVLFVIFNDTKQKGESFNFSIELEMENYFIHLLENRRDFVQISGLGRIKIDSVQETYRFPNSDKFKSLRAVFRKHFISVYKGKVYYPEVIGNQQVIAVSYSSEGKKWGTDTILDFILEE